MRQPTLLERAALLGPAASFHGIWPAARLPHAPLMQLRVPSGWSWDAHQLAHAHSRARLGGAPTSEEPCAGRVCRCRKQSILRWKCSVMASTHVSISSCTAHGPCGPVAGPSCALGLGQASHGAMLLPLQFARSPGEACSFQWEPADARDPSGAEQEVGLPAGSNRGCHSSPRRCCSPRTG